MAAQRNNTPPDDRGTLQVIVVTLNGNNTTIQNALTTVQNMMRKEPASVRPALAGKAKAKELPAPTEDTEGEETLFDEAEVDGEIADTPLPPPPHVGTKRKTRLPEGIADLNFDSASPTLRELVAEKKPQDLFDWYSLIAFWMKKHKDVAEIGLPHIVTAKQYLQGDMPGLSVDASTPFRDGRRPNIGIFDKGFKNGLSKLTENGLIRVERMGQKE